MGFESSRQTGSINFKINFIYFNLVLKGGIRCLGPKRINKFDFVFRTKLKIIKDIVFT
jgi:hypothetical protein